MILRIMVKTYIVFFVFCFICCSCSFFYQDSYPVYEKKIDLKYESLGCDSLFFKPLCIEVFDSLLLVCESTKENVFKLLNLNTLQIVSEGGRIGNGPNDLICNTILDKIDNKRFQVTDVTNKKILFYDIEEIKNTGQFNPYAYKSYNSIYGYDSSMFIFYEMKDSVYVGLGMMEGGKYAVYANDGVTQKGCYPDNSEYGINPYLIHQGVLHIDRNRDLLLYHSPMGYYYELVSYENNQWKTLITDYIPHPFNVSNGQCLITQDTPCGINQAELVQNGVLLLYSGRTMSEYPKTAFYCDKLFYHTLEGEYKIQYNLERQVSMMAVEELNGRVYVISVNPETYELELGYFQIKI